MGSLGSLVAVGALALGLALAAPPAAPAVRVMAFGDSLTRGFGSTHGAGWRLAFWQRMREEGHPVDMVGSKSDGPETLDARHEAYDDTPLHDVSAGIPEKIRRYQPDFVLVLAGADESRGEGFSPRAFTVNLDVLLDRIRSARAETQIVIATLPPTRFGRDPNAKLRLNELIRRSVREHAGRGEPVSLVELSEVIDPSREMTATHHPNDAGYQKIGESFADHVLGLLGEDTEG